MLNKCKRSTKTECLHDWVTILSPLIVQEICSADKFDKFQSNESMKSALINSYDGFIGNYLI